MFLLNTNEKNNGGFPDTDHMVQALIDNVVHSFNDKSTRNFDTISDKHVNRFIEKVKPKLELDEETRAEMDELRQEL